MRENAVVPFTLAEARQAYPLYATVLLTGVEGWEVKWGRGLSACQREVVLAAELHLSHHLRLQTTVQLAAVLQALPPPSLSAVAVLAHAEPVSSAPGGKANGIRGRRDRRANTSHFLLTLER